MKEIKYIVTYKVVYDYNNVYKSYKKDNYYELNRLYKINKKGLIKQNPLLFSDCFKLSTFMSFYNLDTEVFANEFLNNDGNFMKYYKSKLIVLLKCIIPKESILSKRKRFGSMQSCAILPIELIGDFKNYLKYRDM